MGRLLTAGLLFMFTVLCSCSDDNDEDIVASIEGKWRGTRAEVQVKPFGIPLPFTQENDSFATIMEFHNEGTVIVTEAGQSTTGDYELAGDQLTINVDLSIEDIPLSGTYTVEALDARSLVFFREEDDSIADPDGGPSISGEIKVTLHFERI